MLDLAPVPEAKEEKDDADSDDDDGLKKKRKKLIPLGSAAAFKGFGGEIVPFAVMTGGVVVEKPMLLAGSVDRAGKGPFLFH